MSHESNGAQAHALDGTLTPEDRDAQVNRRSTVSTVFIGLVIGLAITEAVASVRDEIGKSGVTPENFILFVVFMLTTIRFFIGFQLHLMDKRLLSMKGQVWFFDFIVIIIETMMLVFMAEVCTVARSKSIYSFGGLLALLLATDAVWVFIQWAAGRASAEWRRHQVLWGWGVSGVVLLIVLGLFKWSPGGLYSAGGMCEGLWGLLFLNVGAFIFDLGMADHYDLF
jgi:hypothetical protein